MSPAHSYTDFHIDFGGTSVWYHIYTGAKIFYLIPPTPANLKAYANWSVSAKQGCTFFPNVLESPDQCKVFKFYAGDTLMIPSGWIHAVYVVFERAHFHRSRNDSTHSCHLNNYP